MKNLIFINVIILVFFSCRKPNNVNENIGDYNSLSISEFNLHEGNWWRYQVTDFLNNSVDTVKLIVVAHNIISTQDEYKCLFNIENTVVDSSKFIISATGIHYQGLNPNFSFFGEFDLLFPIEVGDVWYSGFQDSTWVVSYTENKPILANEYYVFFLKHIINGFGTSLVQNIRLSKNVGIVEHNIDFFNGFPVQKQNYKLIDFGTD